MQTLVSQYLPQHWLYHHDLGFIGLSFLAQAMSWPS